jgi:putative addiction module component (TIGR02574 family)
MIGLSELRSLPLADRLQLVEALWDSIEEEQHSMPDHPAVMEEIRARKARFMANPSSGIPWETVKERIRSSRG